MKNPLSKDNTGIDDGRAWFNWLHWEYAETLEKLTEEDLKEISKVIVNAQKIKMKVAA